jgi:SH3-like domain-containing protein
MQAKEIAMFTRNLLKLGLVAATAFALSSAAALAFVPFNIEVDKAANVYANRTPQSSVVNHVEIGQIVKVMQIKPQWCFIQIPGNDGWVRCSNLAPFV